MITKHSGMIAKAPRLAILTLAFTAYANRLKTTTDGQIENTLQASSAAEVRERHDEQNSTRKVPPFLKAFIILLGAAGTSVDARGVRNAAGSYHLGTQPYGPLQNGNPLQHGNPVARGHDGKYHGFFGNSPRFPIFEDILGVPKPIEHIPDWFIKLLNHKPVLDFLKRFPDHAREKLMFLIAARNMEQSFSDAIASIRNAIEELFEDASVIAEFPMFGDTKVEDSVLNDYDAIDWPAIMQNWDQ